jgi:hypothetical protein
MFGIRKRKYIESELKKWREKYPQAYVPKNLGKRKRSDWISEVYLAKDGKEIVISGGGRILLWLVLLGKRPTWKKHLLELEQKNQLGHYIEALQFMEREKLLKTNLLKAIPKANIARLIENF